MTRWDTWWLKIFHLFLFIGVLGWVVVLISFLFPTALRDTVFWIGIGLVITKVAGVILLVLAEVAAIFVRWLRRPIQSLKAGEEVREFIEMCILLVLLMGPPTLAERWYGTDWLIAAAITAAVVLPLVWKPFRLRRPW
jgi:hypothetical protein